MSRRDLLHCRSQAWLYTLGIKKCFRLKKNFENQKWFFEKRTFFRKHHFSEFRRHIFEKIKLKKKFQTFSIKFGSQEKNHVSVSWKLSEHAHSDYFLMMECVGGISVFLKNASRALFLGSNNKYLISAIRKIGLGPFWGLWGSWHHHLYWSM